MCLAVRSARRQLTLGEAERVRCGSPDRSAYSYTLHLRKVDSISARSHIHIHPDLAEIFTHTYIHTYTVLVDNLPTSAIARPAAQPNLLQQQVLTYIHTYLHTYSHVFMHIYIQKVSVGRKVLQSLSGNVIQLFNDVSKDLKSSTEFLDVSLRQGSCI